ncbi:hypothetical protein NM688_g1858 [Phlebia brevispora]|uniref:Uncharacterized protein n=1 Tax=Phlebia brevispora TaxID=194682 RepID=A0ACC1TA03_9APHY|nr:hypothetical protein NM688_g1858 [Phlebia brevispora]
MWSTPNHTARNIVLDFAPINPLFQRHAGVQHQIPHTMKEVQVRAYYADLQHPALSFYSPLSIHWDPDYTKHTIIDKYAWLGRNPPAIHYN